MFTFKGTDYLIKKFKEKKMMKHDLRITVYLILLFVFAHLIGLFIIQHYLPEEQRLPLNIEKPKLEEKTSYIPIFLAILFASSVALLLVKFKALGLWKLWFCLSVFFTLTIAFSAFFPQLIAIPLSLVMVFFKVIKPKMMVHNFTEMFIYGGLAALFVPVLNFFSIIILLVLISLYDMVAVWKTKHMISLAKFQSESKIFAGLFIPYEKKEYSTPVKLEKKTYTQVKHLERHAILGGGDIGFPLLFSGVVLKSYGFLPGLVVSLVTAVSLFLLFSFAEKHKFYPAMPFLSVGCLVGYGVMHLIFL